MLSWWLLGIIILICVIAIAIYVDEDNIVDLLLGVSLIYIVFIIIVYASSYDNKQVENVKFEYKNKTEIYSIMNNTGTEGAFALGTGHIESQLYYFIRIGNEKDGYIIKKYNANTTYIIPEEDVTPYVVEKYKIYDVKYPKGVMVGGLLKKITDDIGKSDLEKTEIHLSKNYIQQSFTIG